MPSCKRQSQQHGALVFLLLLSVLSAQQRFRSSPPARVETFSIRTARARIHRTAIQALDRIDESVDGLLSEEYSRNSIDNSFQRTASTVRDDGTSRRLRFDGCNTEILEAREDEGPAPRV